MDSPLEKSAASTSTPACPILLLPPKNPKCSQKTLVLDFQNILLQTSWEPLPAYDFTCILDGVHYLYVLKRPGVDHFLGAMAQWFELVMFTSTVKAYANAVLDKLDPNSHIKHRLYRDACKRIENRSVKDLCVLGRDMQNVIILDDAPHAHMLQPENAIQIPSFRGDLQDKKLYDFTPILAFLAKCNDVPRSLHKIRTFQQRSTITQFPNQSITGPQAPPHESEEKGFFKEVWRRLVSLMRVGMTRRRYFEPPKS
eukprot:c34738_g1_i1 orf=33-797(-)